jgi:CheY-like chemotaxis protein
MGGRANTVNRWSGPPSEPFAGRHAPTNPWHRTTVGSSVAPHTDHEWLSPRGNYRCHTNPDSRPHLLMVEDDAALSQTLVQTVMTHLPAMKVTAVSTVEHAWPILEEGDVSLLITVLNLPGIQSCSFIQRLRERGWHGPVIVMSGAPLQGGREVGKMLQIAAVLAKPFEMTSFLRVIAAALTSGMQGSFEERT